VGYEDGGRPSARRQSRPGRGGESGAARRRGTERARHPARELDGQPSDAGRYRSRRERNFELPRAVREELRSADGRRAGALERRITLAAQAYERDRYKEALSAIRPVVEEAPESVAARELYGLILYRLGRWRHAAKELRQVHEATGSLDQHPVIADCERAMGHFDRVEELWDELRTAGVDREVLVEGRLVMAGALADTGRVGEAIDLLRPAERATRRQADVPLLREWYALADLYEAVGEIPRARELFQRVARQAPELLDAPERLRALR
jgi:tetratricopeptide (TPR) repeat protein